MVALYLLIGMLIGLQFVHKHHSPTVEIPTLCMTGVVISLIWPFYIIYKIYDKIKY